MNRERMIMFLNVENLCSVSCNERHKNINQPLLENRVKSSSRIYLYVTHSRIHVPVQ